MAGFIIVVAAELRGPSGQLLLAQRPPGRHRAGQWEFPGGKVEPGETPALALCREIEEELGIGLQADALSPVGFAQDAASGDRPEIVLLLYRCDTWSGQPEGRDGQAWGWFDRAAALQLDLPPMDRALLQKSAN